MYKKYQVAKASGSVALDGKWDGPAWAGIEVIDIKHYMGKEPEHQPKTQAKLMYDDKNIYAIFRVEDKYVRAISQKHQDMVCRDSCVEFFFTPDEDISQGYFNLETNCGATLLFYHQKEKGKNVRAVATEDCQRIKIMSSMPKKVDPEIAEPTLWTVKYALPIAMLKEYTHVTEPGPGVVWKANFYKCADKTSHPHWLTWNPVDRPRPNFHLPQYFGTIVFE